MGKGMHFIGLILAMLQEQSAKIANKMEKFDDREWWVCQNPRLLGTPCGMKSRGPKCLKCEAPKPCL